MPHLPSHGAPAFNGNLQGPVTLTPIAERVAVELSRLRSIAEHPTFSMRGERYNRLHLTVT